MVEESRAEANCDELTIRGGRGFDTSVAGREDEDEDGNGIVNGNDGDWESVNC